jgi:hypothetical protein
MAATKILSNAVLDAALAVVSATTKLQVVNSSSTILIDSIVIGSANFSGSNSYSSGSTAGRNLVCLVSSASSNMAAISVTTTGAAKKLRLLNGASVECVAVMTSAVSVLSTDQVNIGTFSVIMVDPT